MSRAKLAPPPTDRIEDEHEGDRERSSVQRCVEQGAWENRIGFPADDRHDGGKKNQVNESRDNLRYPMFDDSTRLKSLRMHKRERERTADDRPDNGTLCTSGVTPDEREQETTKEQLFTHARECFSGG